MVALSLGYQIRNKFTYEPFGYLLPKNHSLVNALIEIEELGSSLGKKDLLKLRLIAKNVENTPLLRTEAIKQMVNFLRNPDINITNMDYQNSICVLKLLVDSNEPRAIIEEALTALTNLGIK